MHICALVLVQTLRRCIFDERREPMERAAKLQRLDEFRRCVPYVSAAALEAILHEARFGIPELIDRNSMREARDLQLTEETPYGSMLHKLTCDRTDGSTADLTIISPFAMLYIATLRCKGFEQLIRRTIAAHPPSYERPWRLIVYSDEIIPGNVIAARNVRKLWVLYWSFFEFGVANLSEEDAWFCIAAERTDRVKQLEGGMAQVFGQVLQYLFAPGVPEDGVVKHSLKDGGVRLRFAHGSHVRIFAELFMILQDGGAHKQVFCVKGDAGLKQCIECRNFYAKDHGVVDEEAGEGILTCASVLGDEMDFATDDEVRRTVQRLAEFKLTLTDKLFKLREMSCGFNHNRYNLHSREGRGGRRRETGKKGEKGGKGEKGKTGEKGEQGERGETGEGDDKLVRRERIYKGEQANEEREGTARKRKRNKEKGEKGDKGEGGEGRDGREGRADSEESEGTARIKRDEK